MKKHLPAKSICRVRRGAGGVKPPGRKPRKGGSSPPPFLRVNDIVNQAGNGFPDTGRNVRGLRLSGYEKLADAPPLIGFNRLDGACSRARAAVYAGIFVDKIPVRARRNAGNRAFGLASPAADTIFIDNMSHYYTSEMYYNQFFPKTQEEIFGAGGGPHKNSLLKKWLAVIYY